MRRPCANCGKHDGTTKWIGEGGALALTHGFYEWWCRECILDAQIAYAEAQSARLPELRAELDQLRTPMDAKRPSPSSAPDSGRPPG